MQRSLKVNSHGLKGPEKQNQRLFFDRLKAFIILVKFLILENSLNMNNDFQEVARKACHADEIFHIEDIQSLWSGYGKIMRYGLKGEEHASVVIKHVTLPDQSHHPRGWNTDLSHQRKIRSYQVESACYRYTGAGIVTIVAAFQSVLHWSRAMMSF